MNNFYAFLLSLIIITGSISCKKDVDGINAMPVETSGTPTTPTPAGAVTPVGTPVGAIITATIGPAGGTIESADKRIHLTIPSGALASNQTLSLQPINQNHCPLGTGQAFRLLPHGQTFARPVTLTMHYDAQDLNGSAPQLLRVAYQTDKGHWQSPATKSLDTTARMISVQTTHFSDWGLFQAMKISPYEAFLNPGEEVELNVLEIPVKKYDDELLVAIPTRVPAQYIEKWTLRGEGILVSSGNQGAYYAPKKIPANNPETVTVFLSPSTTLDGLVFKDLRLVANFLVAPEGISFQTGKDNWQTHPGGANINPAFNVVAGRVGEEHVQIGWRGAPSGTYAWTAGTDVAFLYVNGKFSRSHMYFKAVSGGALRVNNDHPQWVVGTFTLTSAGWYDLSPYPPAHGTAAIKGVFRVKRVN